MVGKDIAATELCVSEADVEVPTLGMRLPKWQFQEPLRSAIPELFKALGTKQAWSLLSWLETPLGSLAGRTPRAAIEHEELARVVDVAKFDG